MPVALPKCTSSPLLPAHDDSIFAILIKTEVVRDYAFPQDTAVDRWTLRDSPRDVKASLMIDNFFVGLRP
jgi:hypothetical protein